MEYRRLGQSGLKVSVLTLGTMTYGGRGNFAKVGSGGAAEVARALTTVSISSIPPTYIPTVTARN